MTKFDKKYSTAFDVLFCFLDDNTPLVTSEIPLNSRSLPVSLIGRCQLAFPGTFGLFLLLLLHHQVPPFRSSCSALCPSSAGPSNISFVNSNMAAVNMQMMQANMPLDFLPLHSHSRSDSVSSSSTHSSSSRPQSAHGISRMGMGPSPEDIYRATYHLGQHNLLHGDPVRLLFSLCSFLYRSVHFSRHQIIMSPILLSRTLFALAIFVLESRLPLILETPTASTLPRVKLKTSLCISVLRPSTTA